MRRKFPFFPALGLAAMAAAYGQTTKKMTQLALLRLTDANGASASGNAGIWGWVGSDGTEYALPTTMRPGGIAVVSLKDPRNPKQLFHLKSPDGTWHELLTVGSYLYKCSEQGDLGMQIWDLSPLPNAPRELPSWKGVTTCHSLWSDSLSNPRRVYVEGSGDIKILSLANPGAPVQIGRVQTQVHDGMARAGRLYVSTGGGRSMDIWDASNAASPTRLGRAMIGTVSQSLGEPAGYSHNVWLTDDNKYAITTEETDNCTVKMWDISDERNPKFTGGKYLANPETGRMAHNIYIRRHLAYLSHYGSGLRVLSFANPAQLVEVAFHNPGGSSWGAFPWLPSGILIHGNGGLRVVDPDPDIKIVGGGTPVVGRKFDNRFAITRLDRGEIRFQLPASGPYVLSIFTPAGREVFKTRGLGAGLNTLPLDLSAGNYLVSLDQEKKRFEARLAVNK